MLFATGTTAAVRCAACLFLCFLQCFYEVRGMTALLVVKRTPSTGSRTGKIGTTCLSLFPDALKRALLTQKERAWPGKRETKMLSAVRDLRKKEKLRN